MSGWPNSEMETWWVHLVVISQRLFSVPDMLAWVYREAVMRVCPDGCLLSQLHLEMFFPTSCLLQHLRSPLEGFAAFFLGTPLPACLSSEKLPCSMWREDFPHCKCANSWEKTRGRMSLPSLSVYLSVSLCVSICMSSRVLEALDPLGLELQVVLRHLIRVMGFESRSFARAMYAPISWGVSPVPQQLFLSVQKPLLAGWWFSWEHYNNQLILIFFSEAASCVCHISLFLKLIIIACVCVCVHAVDCRHTYHGTHGG